MFYYVEKYGFFAIMVFASVPNPLFDLAGLTCGHFGIAFWTFFLATAVGKALFKTTFQSVGYTMLFHKHTLDRVRTFLDAVFPPAAHLIDSMLHRVSLSIVKGCYAPHRIETGTCRSCCDELRLPVEPHAECVAKCDPENQVDAEETWAQAAWTLFIVGMITFFVVSIIHHSVHERVSREVRCGGREGRRTHTHTHLLCCPLLCCPLPLCCASPPLPSLPPRTMR